MVGMNPQSLFDTNSTNSKEFIQNQIVKCIDLAKGGVHGVLYVASVKNRFTAEEAAVLDSLQLLFGPDIINYMVVVFTGGDELVNDGVTFQDYLNDCTPQLEDVLRRCSMRTVLFDNKTTSQTMKEKQTTELIKQIENIMAKNGGKPYSNELLRQAQENSEKILGRQTSRAEPGRAYEEEVERVTAEHIKQLNAMVEEKMQATIKTYEEKLAHEQAARRKAEKTTEDTLQLSKELQKTQNKSENSCLHKFRNYASEKLASMGCTIM
ncbi:immune-associated nucleotide-binding protein 9 [Cryptomeria japonica]|uniref:immune-associated nucleotide-binding protein 9 n=1 Tax=Cryptomeria japonica TaxID=3369 RepID=UPI0027DA2E75|nr:immune-associated nucleotide-binding protein 9 [Cryptomeria japonica]